MEAAMKSYTESDVKKWRGYSIDELEQRRFVNHIKCDLVKEQFAIIVKSSSLTSMVSAQAGGSFSNIMKYSAYGFQFIKSVKGLYSIYKSIKDLFGSHNQQETTEVSAD